MSADDESFHAKAVRLVGCFFGLQFAFVTWGVMQETLMTTTYPNGGKFPSSVFPVFSDRVVACALAAMIVRYKRAKGELKEDAPSWVFAPSACSNVHVAPPHCSSPHTDIDLQAAPQRPPRSLASR